jgi:hypothetical protein
MATRNDASVQAAEAALAAACREAVSAHMAVSGMEIALKAGVLHASDAIVQDVRSDAAQAAGTVHAARQRLQEAHDTLKVAEQAERAAAQGQTWADALAAATAADPDMVEAYERAVQKMGEASDDRRPGEYRRQKYLMEQGRAKIQRYGREAGPQGDEAA